LLLYITYTYLITASSLLPNLCLVKLQQHKQGLFVFTKYNRADLLTYELTHSLLIITMKLPSKVDTDSIAGIILYYHILRA